MSAKPASDSHLVKFSFLDGKLKIGSIGKVGWFEMEVGELNLYKVGAIGGAVYCGVNECDKTGAVALLEEALKIKEPKEAFESVLKSAASVPVRD